MLKMITEWYKLRLAKRRAELRAECLSLRLKIDFAEQMSMLKNSKIVHINHNTREGHDYEQGYSDG
jgi:hypothetical protein